jgi:hypothetical protein
MQENSNSSWAMDVCTNADASEWLNNHHPHFASVMATLGSFFELAHMKTVSRTFKLTNAYCGKKIVYDIAH